MKNIPNDKPVRLSHSQFNLLNQMIQYWKVDSLIDHKTAEKLLNSYTNNTFNWKLISRCTFTLSAIFTLIAFQAMVFDNKIIQILKQIFHATDIIKTIFFVLLSIICVSLGYRLNKKNPKKYYRSESLYFLGAVSAFCSYYFLNKILSLVELNSIHLFLFASITYLTLAIALSSVMFWLLGILTINVWSIFKISYLPYQNKPEHFPENYESFIIFGLIFILISLIIERLSRKNFNNFLICNITQSLSNFSLKNKILGLFNLCFGLWWASLAKYSNHIKPILISHSQTLGVVASFITSLIILGYGYKKKDVIFRAFGLGFLIINIYSQYINYFAEKLHYALFFAIFAASLWLLGSYLEKIWQFNWFSK